MNCIPQAPAWAHSKEDIPACFPVAQTSICICSVLNYFSNASTFWCCWYSFFFFKLNDLTENYRSYCFCHWGKKTKNKKKIPDWERANFRLVSQKLFDLFSQTFELVSWHFEILKSKRWDTDLKFWLLGGKIFSFVFFFSFFKFRGGNKLPQKTALKRTAVEILPSGGRCCHYVGRKRFIVGHVVLHTNYGHFIAFNFLWATWNNLAGGIHLVFGWVVRCRISEEEWVGNSCVISRQHLDT